MIKTVATHEGVEVFRIRDEFEYLLIRIKKEDYPYFAVVEDEKGEVEIQNHEIRIIYRGDEVYIEKEDVGSIYKIDEYRKLLIEGYEIEVFERK